MKVEVWSDVACPWCYIGKVRFERAVAEIGKPVDVTYRSYQLDPSLPAHDPTRHKGPRLEGRWRRDGVQTDRIRPSPVAHGQRTPTWWHWSAPASPSQTANRSNGPINRT